MMLAPIMRFMGVLGLPLFHNKGHGMVLLQSLGKVHRRIFLPMNSPGLFSPLLRESKEHHPVSSAVQIVWDCVRFFAAIQCL